MPSNYFLKKYVLRYLENWGLLSVLFCILFVFAKVDLETPKYIYLSIILVWVFIMSGIMIARNGLLPMIGIHRFQDKDADILNSFINIDGHVVENISDEDLRKLFYCLKKENILGAQKGMTYSFFLTILPSALTMYLVGVSVKNILIVIMGGLLGVVIISSFIMFFSENFFANTLKECRKIMVKRGIMPDEKIYITSLKGKFNYFVFLMFLLIFITLSFVPHFTPILLFIIVIAFIMITILSRLLFSTIFSVFKEIKEFASKLPQEKKIEYFTGSSYKEVLELSRDLNKSAEETYRAREKERKAREEAEKRKEELERVLKAVVGRELRMIELKQEIKKLEEKLKEKQ